MISPRVFRLVCIIIENRVDSEGISDFCRLIKTKKTNLEIFYTLSFAAKSHGIIRIGKLVRYSIGSVKSVLIYGISCREKLNLSEHENRLYGKMSFSAGHGKKMNSSCRLLSRYQMLANALFSSMRIDLSS